MFAALLVSSLAVSASATESVREFDVPGSEARESLKRFAAQAQVEIAFPSENTLSVRTNTVRGRLTTTEALATLLAGTGLTAMRDARTGAYAVRPEASSPNVPRADPEIRPARPSATARDVPIELSPFVISESSETGWVATETLAGSRLRTDFRDVPNQIETLTKDFMQDLGITNLDQALIYTANAENATEWVPITGVSQAIFPHDPARIRGVGNGTLSRNFFTTRNPTDNYNLDRATVASGPNAILFGLGSPSGIFDATPARAEMRNRYGFSLQYDSENSKRATFDGNVVVVPQRLSLRLMGLSKKEYTEKKPNLDRDDRLYATLTVKPFKKTTLILQGERSSRTWSRAARVTPGDFVTPWLRADTVPGAGYNTARPLYDNSTPITGIASNRIFNQASENPVMIQGASAPIQSWRNSVTVRSPGTLPGVDPTFDAAAAYSITDPSIFPFDVNIVGSSRANRMQAYNKTIVLEQKLTETLFLELAYNREDSSNHQYAAGGQNGEIRLDVDANRFLPGTTTPNPNVGQYYFQGSSSSRLFFFDLEDLRATLSYERDLGRDLGRRHGWLKWLGRHRLAGLYTESRATSINQVFNSLILDDPALVGVTLRPKTFQNWATHPTRTPMYRHYLGNPYEATVAAGSFTAPWTLSDANGRAYTVSRLDTPLRAADGRRLGGINGPAGSRSKTDAMIFAWQGFFLPDRERRDRLVLTYGYRKDSARTAGLDPASIRQDFSGLFPVLWDSGFASYGPKQAGINRNIGVVARPLRWLSLSYNKSTTFDLSIGRYDPFGNSLPGAGGSGRDYGIRLELWQDRLALKLNKYEMSLGPIRASNQINTYSAMFANIENRVVELDPGAPRINVTDGNLRGFPSQPGGVYNVSAYNAGEGYEAEINFSPTRSWNIRLNGAQSKATESEIGREWFVWLEQRLPVWQGVVAKNGEVDDAGRPATWRTAAFNVNQPTGQTLEQYYNSALVGQALAFISAVDGRSNPSVRSHRANAILNYRFHEGRLKGFNIGGAFRYRAAPILGYGTATSSGGITVLDLNTVYKGKQEQFVDLMAGYRGRLNAFGGMNYRIQLNIRNLLDENDPVPMGALTTGVVFRVATVDSRVTAVTFGVDF